MTASRPLVLIESPFSHPKDFRITLHRAYLEACLFDSIERGEVPIATHKLYIDCLNDQSPSERTLGMEMFHELAKKTDYHAVYFDLGVSPGMEWGITMAIGLGKRIDTRSLFGHSTPYSLSLFIADGRRRAPPVIDNEIPF